MVSETSGSRNVVSYLDLLIDMSNGDLACSIVEKGNVFDFHTVNFPYLSWDIPTDPAYDTYKPRFFHEKADEKLLQIYGQMIITCIEVQQESIINDI